MNSSINNTNNNLLEEYLKKLYTNKRFIEDAKKEFDLSKNVEHNPLTEEIKQDILSRFNYSLDFNFILVQYMYLIKKRQEHIDSDFDFIPDDVINTKICICEQCFSVNNPYFLIYASLYKEFKEVCKTPGKMPKIIRQIHIPENLDYHKLENCVNEDGTYNLDGTGIYFEN